MSLRPSLRLCCQASSRWSAEASTSTAAVPRVRKPTLVQERMALLGEISSLEPFQGDDLPSASHLMYEKERERRHYARVVEFQLPQLARTFALSLVSPLVLIKKGCRTSTSIRSTGRQSAQAHVDRLWRRSSKSSSSYKSLAHRPSSLLTLSQLEIIGPSF